MSLTVEQELFYVRALLASGNFSKSIEVLKELVIHNPSNISILSLLSETLRKNEEPIQALKYAQRLLAL